MNLWNLVVEETRETERGERGRVRERFTCSAMQHIVIGPTIKISARSSPL